MTSGFKLETSIHRGRLGAFRVFLVLRWITLKKVPRVGVVRHWLYLAAKVFGVGPARCSLIPSLQWSVMPFPGLCSPRAWIFVAVLTVRIPALPVLEAPGEVPSQVMRMGHK
jgi:hypothetical protein